MMVDIYARYASMRESIAANKFVAFFCGVLGANTRTFRYCNAGHPYPILVSADAAHTLDDGGAVLGVFPSWNYQDSSVNLKSGDRLLLFTDGITEAEDTQGEEFGVDRVAASGRAHAASSAAVLNEQLLAQVSDFCGAIPGRRHLGGSRRKLRTLEIAKRVFYGTVNLGHAFSRDFGTRVFGNCNGIGLQSRPADPGGESRRAPQMLFAIR
jgi:hypothetical protein